jgi:hypothetical protein
MGLKCACLCVWLYGGEVVWQSNFSTRTL